MTDLTIDRLRESIRFRAVKYGRRIRYRTGNALVRILRPEGPPTPPVVVGAMGGSGTRAVAAILMRAGVWLGAWTREENVDSVPIGFFLTNWLDRLVDHPGDPPNGARAAFEAAIWQHRRGMPDPQQPWGWKNPRSMWLIPFFRHSFPELRFVHVVRDGRDMALSSNWHLLRRHGDTILGPAQPDRPDLLNARVEAQLELWAEGNTRARTHGGALGSHYVCIRYEDLCRSPEDTVRTLLTSLGIAVDATLVSACAAEVSPPASVRRWQRSQTSAVLERPPADVRAALESFGYET